MLQVLLNSHRFAGANGRRLRVDGEYGPQTRFAVAAAGRATGIAGDGETAPIALLRQLLTDVDLQVVSSVDIADARLQADVDVLTSNYDDPILLGGMCNGLAQMVQEVRSRGRPGKVALLRFDGHGNLGEWLTVSVGNVAHIRRGDAAEKQEYARIEQETNSYISAQNFNRVSGAIQPLRSVFAPFGFAEHRGCTLGARPQTRAMLQRLADLWNVPIRVGIQRQTIGLALEISGPAFTAYPRGRNLHTWSEQFQLLDLPGASQAPRASAASTRTPPSISHPDLVSPGSHRPE
ncbi:hypothetical protein [Sphingomonas sp.]|uniref:hypothetical protein n=1 Tax=Sphingomonas sp. TaxID=28214 RepID=UPI003CC554F5